MLSISHAVTGAFIAVKIGNPVLAVPLILISHYLEDAVPHWDVGTGLGKGLKSPRAAFIHELIDLSLTLVIILAFYPTILTTFNLTPIWGAFFGLLPDFLEAPANFWRAEPRWLAPFSRFHHSFHHSIPRIIDGLAPQFILLSVLWYFH